MKRSVLFFSISVAVTVGVWAQAPAAPANLTVSSASNAQVTLTWTASSGATSYVVQRRPLGGAYASLTPSATTTTFTDSTIDAFTTYGYIVFAVSAGGTSTASNEVQTGPPPVGFNVVAQTPLKTPDPSQYGQQLTVALNGNGDPVLAFVYYNPSGSGNATDSTLNFVSWDRVNYQWKTPIQVAVCGLGCADAVAGGVTWDIALAFDSSTGRLGLVYQQPNSQMGIIYSTDGGVTWSSAQAIPVDGADPAQFPSLTMAGGTVYFAFFNGNGGINYFTGSETAAPSAWTKTAVPVATKGGTFDGPVNVALDSTGKPGVAYLYDEPGGASSSIGFWRPGNSAPVRAIATGGVNTGSDIRLAFNGTNPRIFASYFNATSAAFANQAWVSQSTDGGTTWTTPVAIPNDGSTAWGGGSRLAFANNSAGFATVVATLLSSNGSIAQKCGNPKWSQSSDFKTWITCSPQGSGSPLLNTGLFPTAAYAANGKIYLGFNQFDNTNAELPTGIIVYREPPVAGQTPPQLSTGGAVNGASFAPGAAIAPGSIFSIFGTNLTALSGGSTSVPLSTTLVASSVSVAGLPAPLYYVGTNQINAQVPFAVPTGTQKVSVAVSGLESNSITVPIANSAPGIFLYNGNFAVAQRADYTLIGPNNGAQDGSVIIVYATGQGPVNNQPATGAAAGSGATAQLLVTATIGGQNAPVQYAGLVQGLVGLLQVNVQTPTGLAAGNYPLIITIGGAASNTAQLPMTP